VPSGITVGNAVQIKRSRVSSVATLITCRGYPDTRQVGVRITCNIVHYQRDRTLHRHRRENLNVTSHFYVDFAVQGRLYNCRGLAAYVRWPCVHKLQVVEDLEGGDYFEAWIYKY
jgi:hypothetical protein